MREAESKTRKQPRRRTDWDAEDLSEIRLELTDIKDFGLPVRE